MTAESQIQAVERMFDSGPQKCCSGKWPSASRNWPYISVGFV